MRVSVVFEQNNDGAVFANLMESIFLDSFPMLSKIYLYLFLYYTMIHEIYIYNVYKEIYLT